MDEISFNSINDLYNRLKPALRSKVKELKIKYSIIVRELDIFNYLSDNKWSKDNDLTLYDMVDDIMYLDDNKLLDYVSKNITVKEMMVDERDNL